VEGSTTSKTEEKPTSIVSVRRAGYVGAQATPRVMDLMAHPGKERNEENIWMMVRTWTSWNLTREPLGTSWPEGV
jgi:hypothetical protein